jgi:hypothetical protein
LANPIFNAFPSYEPEDFKSTINGLDIGIDEKVEIQNYVFQRRRQGGQEKYYFKRIATAC